MTTLLVHESHWGNTRAVAEAIAEGMAEGMAETMAGTDDRSVEIVDVGAAPSPLPAGVDLLVVGGPTHAFSMSRASTRHDAHDKGAEPGHEGRGIREWLADLPTPTAPPHVATFDTRVSKARRLPGSAARSAGKYVGHHHLGTVVATESFYVEDLQGPLLEGELDRARAWGRDLASVRA
jgi:hypothetical protein